MRTVTPLRGDWSFCLQMSKYILVAVLLNPFLKKHSVSTKFRIVTKRYLTLELLQTNFEGKINTSYLQ